METRLEVVPCEGIRPDSLGGYLAGLGLLSALAGKWSDVRGCWQKGRFCVVRRGISRKDIEDYLLEWKPQKYELWWDKRERSTKSKQERSTKSKSEKIWIERNDRSDLREVLLLDAHIVGSGRIQFNPVFGIGGKVGRRNFAKTFQAAQEGISEGISSERAAKERLNALKHSLWGEPVEALPKLLAGTWFVHTNKAFNSGQDWFEEGKLSPWSYLLAVEGARLLVGNINRRLSATARPYAAFPFVSDSPSPLLPEEVGLAHAEFWAPLWDKPATLVEVRTLLERGMARVGKRDAKAPHEFALAARAAGVDSGVSEFARFVLQQTTSKKTFEAIPQGRIAVVRQIGDEYKLLEPLLLEGGWLDRLPPEPRRGEERSKFKGLRGPVERAILELAADPDNAERWQNLLLVLANVQARIDRNKDLRQRCAALPLLEERWFDKAWPEPPAEIQVACAVASIGAGTENPILVNIFGVEIVNGKLRFPEQRPQRAVWSRGEPTRVFANVLQRRLIDAGSGDVPLQAARTCSPQVVALLLQGALDWELIARWVSALSLIGWSQRKQPYAANSREMPVDGRYLLSALFRPFFQPDFRSLRAKGASPVDHNPTALFARRILNLLRQGEWEEALKIAQSRYRAWQCAVFVPDSLDVSDATPDLVAASLLVPLNRMDVEDDLKRWLVPGKTN